MKPDYSIVAHKYKGEYILGPLDIVRIKAFILEGKTASQIGGMMIEGEQSLSEKRQIMKEMINGCGRKYPSVFTPSLLELVR